MTTPTRHLTESPYRIDAMVTAGDRDLRVGYAIVDGYGWHVVTRDQTTRVDGHTRSARAAVRAVLGGAG